MKETAHQPATRREFLKHTGKLAVASSIALPLLARAQQGAAPAPLPAVHPGGGGPLRLALVGCGGRGTGAVGNALDAKRIPLKLVAMADVFADRLNKSFSTLKEKYAAHVDVPADRQFVGLDSYRKAMDCLRPGDIVILTSPPAFRWVHFTYAIEKGLHVFMEKPVTVDGPTSRRMLKLAEQADAKNLKVGVGLMSRHSRALQELAKRVHDGAIGEIILQRGYRMHGPVGYFSSLPKPAGENDLLYQIRRFHSFLWASGGNFSDFYIHIIDHLGWMKNAWPVRAVALGGRHYRQSPEGKTYVDQNFDVYSVEYTYADGTKFIFGGRCITGCYDHYASYMHGTKGSAIASKSGDCGLPSSLYRSQSPKSSERFWESNVPEGERDPYLNEWVDLLDAIQNDTRYNETKRGVEASLVCVMGRMSAHTGQEITWDDALNCEHEFAPGLDQLTENSPAPLQADAQGRYPVPQPGIVTNREY
ncbi:MAG: Gfo/Idh/MocA family oxidoreductase [Verrucomicrobiae bacterium]|nr:Gfo/Idh/MocA family oxidoreductase [Verrucomicrobiae bacterium]